MDLSGKLKFCLAVLITAGLAMPETTAELAFGAMHALYELVEFSLDLLIEHIFHTDRHTTQVIVFYLMLSMAAGLVYRLSRRLPVWIGAAGDRMVDLHGRLKEGLQKYRSGTAFPVKTKWAAGAAVLAGALVLAFFR
ncbi:MAG: hypothetical protein ACU833_11950 [Gammaproteobacteria bacterium]